MSSQRVVRRAVDDWRINVSKHDDVERATGTVAEIVLNSASDGVRADGERRTGWRSANQIGDDAGAGVAHDWQRIGNIGEARACQRGKARLDDDIGRANDVEAGTVGASDAAKRDRFCAEIHDATDLTDPVCRDRRPVGDKERAENRDAVRAAQWNICPAGGP